MKKKLAIVTGNPLKFRELSSLLSDSFDCQQVSFNGYEIQGTSEEILKDKLKQAYAFAQMPVLVDDTSIEIAELGGFPGPYMKDFSKAVSINGIGKKFEGSAVKSVSLIGVMFSPYEYVIGKGETSGHIVQATENRPPENLDFDPIFQPDGFSKTYAQMSTEEKNAISHRGKAMQDLLSKV